eukprot:2087057-Pyramimonas_sp.AAC.1
MTRRTSLRALPAKLEEQFRCAERESRRTDLEGSEEPGPLDNRRHIINNECFELSRSERLL